MGFLHQKDTVEFDLTSDKDTDLEVTDINIPPFVKLNDFQYGGGITQRYKIKNTKLKTKNKSSIRLLTVEFPQTLLIKLYSLMTPPEGLLPSKLGVWEWRQTFYNKMGSVALRNSKPVFQLGLSISQPKSKRLPQDPNRILPCVSVFYEPYVMFQCLQLIFVRFYRF